MKESPIPFSTEMVQAILEGKKTMTRRIFKDNPRVKSYNGPVDLKEMYKNFQPYLLSFSKYGEHNDILWVRETFSPFGEGHIYKADALPEFEDLDIKWRASMFLPKEAARIWLQITDITIERLQDITNEDALKEGIKVIEHDEAHYDYMNEGGSYAHPRGSFFSLWRKINGDESLDLNPWVWAISFKVLSTTGRPSIDQF